MQEARRLLPRLDRRAGGDPRAGLDQEGSARPSRALAQRRVARTRCCPCAAPACAAPHWRCRCRASQVEVLEYPELGMEAIWKIEVEGFPAFIVVDDKGNDFFAKWSV